MFFLSYIASELRRRRARTILTALGLAVGVALVISVSALSNGLDNAQQKVLQPLTGVGTDMTVTRPIKVSSGGGPFGGLSASERRRLRSEGNAGGLNFRNRKPGSKIDTDSFQTSQLSFSENQVSKTESTAGVASAAGALTLNDVHVSGKVPKIRLNGGGNGAPGGGNGAPGGGAAFGNSSLHFATRTVTGIDQTKASLAAVTPSQIVKGTYFSSGSNGRWQAILSSAYANSNKIALGDTVKLDGHTFTVAGVASSPLGGTASDIYVELGTLQKISGYTGQINSLQVRATSSSTVSSVAASIKGDLKSSQVTTAQTLAKRVGGSLTDTKNLSAKLGTALEVVGLLAAVLIASLLTLSSVAKRVRELGTLKALGWSSFQVVRQISGESLLQGLLGGVLGVALGLAAIEGINAVGWTLKATVSGSGSQASAGPFGLGQPHVTSGSTLVEITTSADAKLIVAAVVLAIAGGLIAGMAGGLRAARLRPAVALRTVE